MSKPQTHTQVLLGKGITRHIAWVPTELAVIGKSLNFKKEKDGKNWEVLETWDTKIDSHWILTRDSDVFGSIQ